MSKVKILVVDDELAIVRAIMLRLCAAGYEVVSATDGEEAMRMVDFVLPDLVILDIGMPKADGHKVAERLLENKRTQLTPIIFLTARTSEKDRALAFETGGARYLTKPFQSQELLDTVARALSCVRRPCPRAATQRLGYS